MRTLHLPLTHEKLDMAADPAIQMVIQTTLEGGVGQEQDIHDLPQTTQMFLTECRPHHHQAEETGLIVLLNKVIIIGF